MPEKPTKSLRTAIRRWSRRHRGALSWGIVSLATASTLVLGVIGFSETETATTPFSTRVYLAFQLLTLESGAVQELSTVNWPLQVARWTGVISSLGIVVNTLVAVFSRQIDAFLLRRLTRHAVVIGVNPLKVTQPRKGYLSPESLAALARHYSGRGFSGMGVYESSISVRFPGMRRAIRAAGWAYEPDSKTATPGK